MLITKAHSLVNWAMRKTEHQDGIKLEGCPENLNIALEILISEAPAIRQEFEQDRKAIEEEALLEGVQDENLDKIQYETYIGLKTIDTARTEAIRRLAYIKSLDTVAKREEELTKCSNGIEGTLHWINTWGWTHDPRAPVSSLPFTLFAKQEEYITWVEDLTFRRQQAGLTAKSREVGVTWCLVAMIIKNWRFRRRFDVLVGSKNEEFVDQKGRDDTLMEKFRFMLRMLPDWMLPKGFDLDKHMPFLNILNPSTGSFIAGESANENFGRQGRYSLLWIDEFPIFPQGGFAAYTSSSFSAKARLYTGTAKGKLNKFYQLYSTSKIRNFIFHWKDDPRKTEQWYKALKLEFSDAEIAQEADINFDASQVGLVFPQWEPLYSVITWSEFADFFGHRARDVNGKPCIPSDWLLMMSQDVGMSNDSRNVTTWAARPKQGYPLTDSVFLYRQYVAPIDHTIDELAELIKAFEQPRQEAQRIWSRKISHEALSELRAYEEKGIDFEQRSTDYLAGLAQCRNYMRVFDKKNKNPFRSHLEIDGQPLMGRSRWYVIVEDKQGLPKLDKGLNRWMLPEPENDLGFAQARHEIQIYHIPESELGKPPRLQRPLKKDDHAMDTWRDIGLELPPIASFTEQEAIEHGLDENLKANNITKIDFSDEQARDQLAMQWLAREDRIAELKAATPDPVHWRRNLYKTTKKGNW